MAGNGCPAILDLSDRLCVIVGGGRGAEVKARTLSRSGARVRVVAEEVSEAILELNTELVKRKYKPGDAKDAFIVFSLTGDREMDELVKSEARDNGALVGGEDITFPACAEGENIKAFVSTGYPKLSAKMMSDILKYDEVCGALRGFRKKVNSCDAAREKRDRLLMAAVTDEALCTAMDEPERYMKYLSLLESEICDEK